MRVIDTRHWKPYRLGTYFEPSRGTVKKLQSLNKGNTPVVAAARSKQGVAGFYDVPALYCNKITVSCNGVGCGSTFFHDYPFNINGDATVLEEKIAIPPKAMLFLACVLDKIFSVKYSYEEKCSPDKLREETINLPSTPDGEPDWYYMEMYMRGVEAIVKNKLDLLSEFRNMLSAQQQSHPQTPITNYGTVNIIDNSRNYNIK